MPDRSMSANLEIFDQTNGWSTGMNDPTGTHNPVVIDSGWTRFGLFIYYTKGTETGVYLQPEVKRLFPSAAGGFSPIQSVTPESPTLNLDLPHRITVTTATSNSCYVPMCFGFWSGFPFNGQLRWRVNITGTPSATTRVALYMVCGG